MPVIIGPTATISKSFRQNLSNIPGEHEIKELQKKIVGGDSSVGIATRCGLDGPGIESRWRRDFSHLYRPALGPTKPPIQWVPDLSRG
jgi:hypothetical protein